MKESRVYLLATAWTGATGMCGRCAGGKDGWSPASAPEDATKEVIEQASWEDYESGEEQYS